MQDPALRPARILLAEDFDDTREMYAEMLTLAGYQVVTAKDGAEAIARAAKESFDAIVLDVALPKVDGITVIRTLRKLPETKNVPIITVSASVGAQLHNAILAAGADVVLDKPCLPEDLEVAILASMDRGRASGEPDPIPPPASPLPDREALPGAPDEPIQPLPMPLLSPETAYYLNSKLPRLALIGKGVRMPRGQWIRVAEATLRPWLAEELVVDMFPALRARSVPFVTLLTDFDVLEFERDLMAVA
jgi:two-component system cell cycle response regulator DivK